MTDPLSDPLFGRRIALGVSGSIAAYKALTLASRLVQAGAEVDVLLTRAAAELVRPLAFQALTHRPVTLDLWDPNAPMAMDHVAIAQSAEMLVVAPATADCIARLALGLADDALTTTALATQAPLLLAPAMEPNMWAHPATQEHVATLQARGAQLVGPAEGRTASGLEGRGRMAEPEEILDRIRLHFTAGGFLAGRRIVVSAGPTREALDPVRYLSNYSSGKMGYAVAEAARDAGAHVILVSGPVGLPAPFGVDLVNVETALEMQAAILHHVLGSADCAPADALVMAAAVADYRPSTVSTGKIKKSAGDSSEASLPLVRNPDILESLDQALAGREPRPIRVGFAAETDDLVPHAREKLLRKGLDLVVANPVPETFDSASGRMIFVDAAGEEVLGLQSKASVAEAILARIARLLAERPA